MAISWTWERPLKRKSDFMVARLCDGCGGDAIYLGVYAMCLSCKDKAIEEFVTKQKDV